MVVMGVTTMKYGLRPRVVNHYCNYMTTNINKYVPNSNTTVEYNGNENVVVRVDEKTETVTVENYSTLTFLSWAILSKIEKLHKTNGNEAIGNKIVKLFME